MFREEEIDKSQKEKQTLLAIFINIYIYMMYVFIYSVY